MSLSSTISGPPSKASQIWVLRYHRPEDEATTTSKRRASAGRSSIMGRHVSGRLSAPVIVTEPFSGGRGATGQTAVNNVVRWTTDQEGNNSDKPTATNTSAGMDALTMAGNATVHAVSNSSIVGNNNPDGYEPTHAIAAPVDVPQCRHQRHRDHVNDNSRNQQPRKPRRMSAPIISTVVPEKQVRWSDQVQQQQQQEHNNNTTAYGCNTAQSQSTSNKTRRSRRVSKRHSMEPVSSKPFQSSSDRTTRTTVPLTPIIKQSRRYSAPLAQLTDGAIHHQQQAPAAAQTRRSRWSNGVTPQEYSAYKRNKKMGKVCTNRRGQHIPWCQEENVVIAGTNYCGNDDYFAAAVDGEQPVTVLPRTAGRRAKEERRKALHRQRFAAAVRVQAAVRGWQCKRLVQCKLPRAATALQALARGWIARLKYRVAALERKLAGIESGRRKDLKRIQKQKRRAMKKIEDEHAPVLWESTMLDLRIAGNTAWIEKAEYIIEGLKAQYKQYNHANEELAMQIKLLRKQNEELTAWNAQIETLQKANDGWKEFAEHLECSMRLTDLALARFP